MTPRARPNGVSRHYLPWLAAALCAAIALASIPANAQIPGTPAPAATEAPPAPPPDALGRDTPEGMVAGFLRAVAADDLARAARYLNLRAIPLWRRDTTGAELASMLREALDRAGWLTNRLQLSGQPTGHRDDGLPPDIDRFGAIRTRTGTVDLLAERMDGPDSTKVWLVSAATVARIPDMLANASSAPVDMLLPTPLTDTRLFGAPVGHWLVLAGLALFGYAFAMTASRGIRWVGTRLLRRVDEAKGEGTAARFLEAADRPLRLLVAVAIFSAGALALGTSIVARQRTGILAEAVAWFALFWFAWRIIAVLSATGTERAARRGQFGALSVIVLARRTAKVAVAAIATVLVLDSMGVNVTAGLAALGIGGLAVALGAQRTIENFVGSLMLITDQPVRVGDFCRFGDKIGVIEDIGMRSTRIRTLDRTVVTVPNGEMASLQIENFAGRSKFWFHPTLALRYETTPDQMRWLLVKLRELLYAHPRVDPSPARVRFTALDADSLRVEIFAYVITTDYDDFLEVQEDLMLRIIDIVNESGSGFAFPSRTVYLARDGKPKAETAAQSAASVREWSDAGELQLPRFSPERIAELRGTIPYPPQGSWTRNKPAVQP